MPFVRHSLHLTTTHKLQIFRNLKSMNSDVGGPERYSFYLQQVGEFLLFYTQLFNLGG